jgi:aminomethyltransferase
MRACSTSRTCAWSICRRARREEFLRQLLANDVGRSNVPGKALYSCMLNPSGGVIDDLIVYYRRRRLVSLVVNAGTRDKDLAWMRCGTRPLRRAVSERSDLAMLAVQGPNARARLRRCCRRRSAKRRSRCGLSAARSSATGSSRAPAIPARTASNHAARGRGGRNYGQRSMRAACAPAALGARDTLRLEAGMNLYGNDMDEKHHPSSRARLDRGLRARRARIHRPRGARARSARGSARKLVGLVLEERGVLRSHQRVITAASARARSPAARSRRR